MPGVSRKTICAPSTLTTPSMAVRVVCGFSETIASLPPTKAFNSVDFPALGRPRIETKPEWNAAPGACIMRGSEIRFPARLWRRAHAPLSIRPQPARRFESLRAPASRPRAEPVPATRLRDLQWWWIRFLPLDGIRAGHANDQDPDCRTPRNFLPFLFEHPAPVRAHRGSRLRSLPPYPPWWQDRPCSRIRPSPLLCARRTSA